jgi:hypothetical protein
MSNDNELSPNTTTSINSYYSWSECMSDSPKNKNKISEARFNANPIVQEAEIIYYQSEKELIKLGNVVSNINKIDEEIAKKEDNLVVIENYTIIGNSRAKCNLCGKAFLIERHDKWFCSPKLRCHIYYKHKRRLKLKGDYNDSVDQDWHNVTEYH